MTVTVNLAPKNGRACIHELEKMGDFGGLIASSSWTYALQHLTHVCTLSFSVFVLNSA